MQTRYESFRQLLIAHALGGLLSNQQIAKDAVKIGIPVDENRAWHAEAAIGFADAVIARLGKEK